MSPSPQTHDSEDSARQQAIDLVNEVLGEELDPEGLSGHRRVLDQRLALLQDRMDAQRRRLAATAHTRGQTLVVLAETNRGALNKAREALTQLEDVMHRTEEIMGPVLRLHQQQRQLTEAITTMERLRSLVVNLDAIEEIIADVDVDVDADVKGKKGGDGGGLDRMAPLLLASQQFAALFRQLKVDACSKLVKDSLLRFETLQLVVKQRIVNLFERQLGRHGAKMSPQTVIRLSHAALSVEVLGEAAKWELTTWYCNQHLDDYVAIFRQNRELFNLQSLEKRYAWFRRLLLLFDTEHAAIFEGWGLDATLCREFCRITAQDISDITSSGKGLELVAIQEAVQQTKAFEQFVLHRFPALPPDTTKGLLRAFEPCLRLILDIHEHNLTDFMSKSAKAKPITVSRTDPSVLDSAMSLFELLCSSLQEVASLSRGRPLLTLYQLFARQLSEYAKALGTLGSLQKKRRSDGAMFMGFRLGDASLIKDSKETAERLRTLAILINTALFCRGQCEILAGNFREIMETKECSEEVALGSQIQEFLVSASLLQGKMHDTLVDELSMVWTMMRATNWAELDAAGDRSEYVCKLQRLLTGLMPVLRSTLQEERQFVSVCTRTALHVVRQFSHCLHEGLKTITEVAAQQLLIDLECLKSMLADCLCAGPEYFAHRAGLVDLLQRETRELESYLKCLMLSTEPVDDFIVGYLMVRPEGDEGNLVAVLEKRGIKKTLPYLQRFRRRIPEPPSATTVDKGPASSTDAMRTFKFFKIDATLDKLLEAVRL